MADARPLQGRRAPTLVVRGGTVVDATRERAGTREKLRSRRADVAVADGVVVAVGRDLSVPRGAVVLDAGGCLVSPGLVDLHAHLRQPGREEAETVETATRAAALGGYTAVVAMPNTDPPADSAGVVREVLELGRRGVSDVAVAGAITLGRLGERLAPMAELAGLGVRLFTDDGEGVQDGGLMRRALDYARRLGVTLAQHCEDSSLAAGGSMHEGEWSSRLGIPGEPAAAEVSMLARDLTLVRLTGTPMHFLHMSTAGSVELLRRAKSDGLPVTAEATPHHFSLTHALTAGYDPTFKVSPPLRGPDDVLAIKVGLREGVLDAVATDHAPHAPESKDVPFEEAPPGMLGLQTALSVSMDELTGEGQLAPAQVLALLSWRPAAIAGLRETDARPGGQSAHGGPIVPGADANLCVYDPMATWTVDKNALASLSRNTPYDGRRLVGRVRHTVLRGEPVVVDAEAQR